MRGFFSLIGLTFFGYLGFAIVAEKLELPSIASTLSQVKEREREEKAKKNSGGSRDDDWDEFFRSRISRTTASKTSIAEVQREIEKLVPEKRDWTKATKCWGTRKECSWLLATEFVENANGVPPLLLVAMARLESNLTAFQKDGTPIKSPIVKGKRDWGIIQVRDWERKGCRMDTVENQIQCGAKFIRKLIDKNDHNLFRGLSAYACGDPKSQRPFVKNFVVAIRVILWQAMEYDSPKEALNKIINFYGRKKVRETANLDDWGPYIRFYRNAPLEV